MQKDRPQKQWIESYGQHWKLKMKSCTPERKEKNRKGKLNENTVNKAFRMGADPKKVQVQNLKIETQTRGSGNGSDVKIELNFNDKVEEILISLIVGIRSAVVWVNVGIYEMGVDC